MDWTDFTQVMLLDERSARAKYKLAARVAEDEDAREVFQKLAYEEEMHISVLQQFQKTLRALEQRKGLPR